MPKCRKTLNKSTLRYTWPSLCWNMPKSTKMYKIGYWNVANDHWSDSGTILVPGGSIVPTNSTLGQHIGPQIETEFRLPEYTRSTSSHLITITLRTHPPLTHGKKSAIFTIICNPICFLWCVWHLCVLCWNMHIHLQLLTHIFCYKIGASVSPSCFAKTI